VRLPERYHYNKIAYLCAELENTATRIPSEFTPEHVDLIEKQRKKQKRRERRIKRAIVSVGGWTVIAAMIYLIVVTARTIPKIWDPYDVLGVSRVCVPLTPAGGRH
jgi:translocation protein SEC63